MRPSLCQTIKDYALAAVGAVYMLGAFTLERLGLVEGRDAAGGPRWKSWS